MNKRKAEKVILLTAIALVLILAAAGTASAVSYTVELPASITPGETVEGTVYFTDGTGEEVSAFSAYIISVPVLTYQGDVIVDTAITDIADPTVSPSKVTWVAPVGDSYPLSGDKVLVGTFSFTAPETPGVYRVTIANQDSNYPSIKTNLGTYENTPGNLPLTVYPAEFTIPGTIPDVYLQIELPTELAAGETAEGSIYILGGKGQEISGYSIALKSDLSGESLNIQIKDDPAPLGPATSKENTAIAFSSGSGSSITLASDKELVGKFSITVPSSPLNSAYSVKFDETRTEIVTPNYVYANFDDGDVRHVHKKLTAAPAVFAVPGSTPAIGIDIVIPESLEAGSTGTGELFLVGGSGQKLTGFQINLAEAGTESLGITIANESGKILGYGTTKVSGKTLVYEDNGGIMLDSSRVKVGEFTFTIPKPNDQHAYAVDFLFNPAETKDTRIYTETTVFGKTNIGTADKSFVYLQASGDVLYIDNEKKPELFSYNGWTQNVIRQSGVTAYDPSTNVTDINTDTEVWTVKDKLLGHFNAVNKSQIVYKFNGSLTEDCQFIDTPQFYGYSGKNISMTYEGSGSGSSIHMDGKVTVKYYSSTQNPLTDTALGEQKVNWDETNKRVNLSEASSLIPAGATECLMFFEGRPQGDVTGDITVEAADITYMSSCFADGIVKTELVKFYGDVTSDGNYESADLTRLSSYRAGGVSEDYV